MGNQAVTDCTCGTGDNVLHTCPTRGRYDKSGKLVGGVKERGILFSAPMIRALLAGTKTQTRRMLKPQPPSLDAVTYLSGSGYSIFTDSRRPGRFDVAGPVWAVRQLMGIEPGWRCPYGIPGDRLWVRETWASDEDYDGCSPSELVPDSGIVYRADGRIHSGVQGPQPFTPGKTRVSIHMPRWASRITLEVTEVRIERVRSISGEDAIAEGIDPGPHRCDCEACGRTSQLCPATSSSLALAYGELWTEINGAESWEANPWVWVVSFKRIQP